MLVPPVSFLLTTPGESTKISGVRVVESSRTACMSSTGGSTNLEPRLLMMNDVAQKETRSGRNDRRISIRCSSLHALSHSPGRGKHIVIIIRLLLMMNDVAQKETRSGRNQRRISIRCSSLHALSHSPGRGKHRVIIIVLLMMNDVAQKETRSGRNERRISIR